MNCNFSSDTKNYLKKWMGMLGDANLCLTVTHREAGACFVHDQSNVCQMEKRNRKKGIYLVKLKRPFKR
jgi:hypothetical protein